MFIVLEQGTERDQMSSAKERSIVVSCPATKSQNQAPLFRESTLAAGSRQGKFVLSRGACQP